MVSVNVLLFVVLYEIRVTRRVGGGTRPKRELFEDLLVALAACGCLCFIAILLVPVGLQSTRIVQLLLQIFNFVSWSSCFFLYNLDFLTYIRDVVARGGKAPPHFDVFLSHNWSEGTHEKMVKLKEALLARGLQCFLDQDNFDRWGGGGDLPAQMTQAMDRSRLFVCTINKEYLEKIDGKGKLGQRDNCKFEFTYAINRMGTKRVVPLVTSQQYTDPRAWHGPVGGFLVDQFWECYLEEKQLEVVADNIAQRVLLYKCEQEAGRELSNDARERIRPHIDDHIKKMKDLKQQAANSRVQRGAVTSY